MDIAGFFRDLHVALANLDPWALIGISALLGGVLVGWVVYAQQRSKSNNERMQTQAQTLELSQQQQLEFDEQRHALEQSIADLRAQEAAVAAQAKTYAEQLDQANRLATEQQATLVQAQAESAAMKARFEESQKGFIEKEKLFKETQAQLKQEFELLANRVFEQQGTKAQASLHTVLNPFKEQMGEFKKKVEEVYLTDTKERATLLSEIKNLQSASERINAEAENLTKALKGDKKLQGNWGELVLERVLEDSGLRKDHEYVVQASKRNDDGDLKRPDVLIALPDNKDIVIDSKVSLNAYEEALASEDEDARTQHLRTHVGNLRNHVKRLSEQNYDQLEGVRSLDFVLLFIPIESAFHLAMELDPKLFTESLNKRIAIVSPTTLMMTLRIIANIWRVEKQNKNAEEIARRAGALYGKLGGVVEEMTRLGSQLETVDKTYQKALGRLSTGKGNLVRQVEQFRELGAKVDRAMPSDIVDKALDEDQDSPLLEE